MLIEKEEGPWLEVRACLCIRVECVRVVGLAFGGAGKMEIESL